MEENNLIFEKSYIELKLLPMDKKYYLIKANTDYLDYVELNKLKSIYFSKEKDVFVLTNEGDVYKNGKNILSNIKEINDICFCAGLIAVGCDNTIHVLTCANDDCINNSNYHYKSIIITSDYVAALTKDNIIKIVGHFFGIIDYARFFNVDNIAYVIDEELHTDVIAIKGEKAISLFKDDTIYDINDPRITYSEFLLKEEK